MEEKTKNLVVIGRDGWVYVLYKGKSIGLGDIGVDVEIEDLRKLHKPKKRSEEMKTQAMNMLSAGESKSDVAKELGISRPTLYKLIE